MHYAQVKRFIECWDGDDAFRKAFADHPATALETYDLEVDPKAVAVLCRQDKNDHIKIADLVKTQPALREYADYINFLNSFECNVVERHAKILNPVLEAWSARQGARFSTQAPSNWSKKNPFLVFSIELSKGCSVGCAYCAGAAEKLRSIAHFTQENKTLFRGILDALTEFSGGNSLYGLLYFFTEPMDNPDYEKYLQAYYDEMGEIPQTTTAAWFRDIGRTRRLLAQSEALDGGVERFSINSLKHFRFCMETFTAEELKKVNLVLHYPEAFSYLYKSGRAISLPDAIDGTTACVCGFLVNLPERTVKLVSPCIEADIWPKGYRILAESTFESVPEFNAFLTFCQNTIMNRVLAPDWMLKFRDDLDVQINRNEGAILKTRYRQMAIDREPGITLVHLIDGRHSPEQIVNQLSDKYSATAIYGVLNFWWDKGLFEDSEGPVQF